MRFSDGWFVDDFAALHGRTSESSERIARADNRSAALVEDPRLRAFAAETSLV